MPWLGKDLFNTGENKICCWLEQSYDIDQIRYDLLNDVKSSACSKCWRAEAQGQQSRRQQQNTLADVLYDMTIENLQLMCDTTKGIREQLMSGPTNYNPTMYQINSSNVCNGACIMCGPEASSKWQSLLKDHNKRVVHDIDIDFATAKYVEFVGGEPLLEQKYVDILEKLNRDCVVSIVTNGSVDIKPQLLNLLKEFKNLVICMSIDGVGPIFEYQRWPLKWNKLQENLANFKQLDCNLSVSYTLTNINLPYKQQTIDWFDSQGLPYIINECIFPKHFAASAPISEKTIQELDRQDALKGIDRRDYGFNF